MYLSLALSLGKCPDLIQPLIGISATALLTKHLIRTSQVEQYLKNLTWNSLKDQIPGSMF